jgi:hypothetical protein
VARVEEAAAAAATAAARVAVATVVMMVAEVMVTEGLGAWRAARAAVVDRAP